MWDALQQQSFIVGAALILVHQAARFGDLYAGDPVTNRYMSLLPGARVRDFAGPYAYHWALGVFLGLSLIVYYLCCLISPEIIKGGITLLGSDADAEKIAAGIPLPLYIAALFTGLTQPIVPGLSQFQTAQLAFFHDQIAVPRRIIDVSESLTVAIDERAGQDKQRLLAEVRKLVGSDFLASLQPHGDLSFYKLQLEKLEVDSGALEATLGGSSVKELRALIERLVLCALVAVSRKSGPKPLAKVAQKLEIKVADVRRDSSAPMISGLLFSGVLLLAGLFIIAELLVLLAPPVSALFDKSTAESLWPSTLEFAFQELESIALPIVICMSFAVFKLVPRGEVGPGEDNADDMSLVDDLLDFVQSNASVLLVCVLVAVLIKIGMMFWEYGTFNLPAEARSPLRLILPALQSLTTLAVCVFTTWYLVSVARKSHGPSFAATVMLIAASTSLLALLYAAAFLEQYLKGHPGSGSGAEYYLFSVIANGLVAVAAFVSVVVFVKARKITRSRSRVDARNAPLSSDASVRPIQAPPLVPQEPIAVAQEPRARLGI